MKGQVKGRRMTHFGAVFFIQIVIISPKDLLTTNYGHFMYLEKLMMKMT